MNALLEGWRHGDFDFDPADFPIEMAKEIWECFGPCSSVQECSTPEDIVKQIADDFAEKSSEEYRRLWGKDDTPWSLAHWLDIQLTVEKVFWERNGIFDTEIPGNARAKLIERGYLAKGTK